MFRRLLRSILCMFLVVILYWGYALIMVPLLEPTVAKKRPREFLANPLEHTSRSREFERLFAADAWERQSAKVLETEHGALLFREYNPQPDGTMELKPVTLVYYTSKGPADPGSLPILVQAPHGAVLQSDRPINLSRADFGKPIGARLLGQIIIRRPASSPEHDDEIFVTTRNVKIDRQRIWTPNDVEFRFGPHWGRGRDLQITFESDDPLGSREPSSSAGRASMTAGVQLLELLQIDKILISTEDQTLVSKESPRVTSNDTGRADVRLRKVPIEVRCRGAFRFDFQQSLASLADDVRLVRRYPDGITDSLRCDLLEMHFAPAQAPVPVSETIGDKGNASRDTTSAATNLSSLAISRVLAQGSPVTLEAPSRDAYAQAEQVEMFFPQQRLVLEGPAGARIRFGQRTFQSPRVEYTFHPDDTNRMGTIEAAGPGRFLGQISDTDSRRFTASWQDVMRLRPLEDRQVLSLHGRPELELQGMGSLAARQLHLFLREGEESDPSPNAVPFELQPDRLVALEDIRLHAAELTGHAQRELKIWFVEPELASLPGANKSHGGGKLFPADVTSESNNVPLRVSPAHHRGSIGNAIPLLNDEPRRTNPSRAKISEAMPHREEALRGPPLDFRGDRVEARVVLGENPQLTDLTVAGDVVITRESEKAETAPLEIKGDLLQINEFGEGKARIEVRGTPAEAGAEGLVLQGEQILCQQATNQVWIPGPGQMRTPSSAPGLTRSTTGGGSSPRPSAAAPPLKIDWKGRMQFDGLLASFLDGVHVHGRQEGKSGEISRFGIRGSELHVELTRRIDFSQPGDSRDAELGIRLLRFPGLVTLENQSSQSNGQAISWEQMEVTHLRVDPVAGRLEADGPGWLSSVRLSASPSMTPGFAPVTPRKSSGLAHIRVGFQRAVVGNLATREVEFFEHVLTTYGPVEDWHERIDPVRGSLGQGGIEMQSDRLRLTEMRSPNFAKEAHYEIQAVGNVEVRGERFQASGYRLSYDDSKDLLILQGNGREYAVVKTPDTNGVHEVKELRIWPKSKKIQSDVRSIDLGPVGSRSR